jgi:hypothetical protein
MPRARAALGEAYDQDIAAAAALEIVRVETRRKLDLSTRRRDFPKAEIATEAPGTSSAGSWFEATHQLKTHSGDA